MNILRPLEPDDDLLRQICKPITKPELGTKEVQSEIDSLLDYVYGNNNKGEQRSRLKPQVVGLSANQVGIMKQISIVDLAIGKKDFNELLVLINPEITWQSKALMEFDEGCVNIPEVWGLTNNRSKRVKVTALTRSGGGIKLDLTGEAAVLLQHEVDHLKGRLFIDHLDDPTRAHRVKKDEFREYKKVRKANEEWDNYMDVSSLVRK